jgi:hypothetical protein
LTKLFDPLASDETTVAFRGVETGQATLTVTGVDKDIPLGSSISYDVSTLTKKEDTSAVSAEPVMTELAVAIFAPETGAEEGGQVIEPICTITLRLTYKPSPKDQREELYERLNLASQNKAAAVEELRQVALAASKQQLASRPTKKPAVQAGFLNKKEVKEPSKFKAFYEKTLGPRSLLRQLLPVATNYIIFFGVTTFFHFQGQQLALPPPV